MKRPCLASLSAIVMMANYHVYSKHLTTPAKQSVINGYLSDSTAFCICPDSLAEGQRMVRVMVKSRTIIIVTGNTNYGQTLNELEDILHYEGNFNRIPIMTTDRLAKDSLINAILKR